MPRARLTTIARVIASSALLSLPSAANAQGEPRVVGRWDLRVQSANSTYPSWLEITTSGNKTLVGRFVGRVGSARPIARVVYAHDTVRFAIPPQWDRDTADLRLEAMLDGERLVGTITTPAGARQAFTGVRAPSLKRAAVTKWSAPTNLFNGKDLTDGRRRVVRVTGPS